MEFSIRQEKDLFRQLKRMMQSARIGENHYFMCLIDLIGATIAGIKPAELLNIPTANGRIRQWCWEECKLCLLRYSRLRIREINKPNGRKQVFIYHYLSLSDVLSDEANLGFLKEAGYPQQHSVETYVDLLVKRLNGKNFPHEIGIFLGYPLKDVLGFIGDPSLKLKRRRGWNFFGNPDISNKRYESFLEARSRVRELAHSIAVPNQC